MTRWDDRFEQHAFVTGLRALRTNIEEALESDDNRDPDAVPWLTRFDRVTQVVQARVEAADPLLVPAATLQNLEGPLQQVQNQLQNFQNNGDVQHLEQADPHLDGLLQHSTALLVAVPWDDREVEDLREHTTNYRRSAGQLVAGLRQDSEEVAEKLAQVKANAEEVDSSRGSKLEELETAVQEQRQNMEQALSQFRENFSTAQDERRNEFTTVLEAHSERSKELLDQLSQEAESQRDNTREQAQELIDDMEGLKEQAATLVDAVGTIGTAAGYGKYAAQQKTNADWLRLSAVGVVLIAVGFAVWALASTGTGVTWQRSVAKLTVVTLLGALAAYLGRQSAVHREREAAAKKVQLELAALDPYLALMDPETRSEVKKEIAQRLFGQPLIAENGGKTQEPMPASQVLGLIGDLVRGMNR